MKLNHHAKELKDTLEALDFRYDERETQRRGGGMYFHHHAEPEQYIKVFGKISPAAARTAMDKARQISGLATVGKKQSSQLKDIARVKREERKAREARDRADYERRADEAARKLAAINREREEEARRREIGRLMNPGFGR